MLAAATRHRLALCEQLDDLTAEQWNADSLCADWRIRDVIGHLVSIHDQPQWKFMVGVFSLSGFDRRANKLALEYRDRGQDELIALMRELAGSTSAPPVIGPISPLIDILTHSLDIQRPLGLGPTIEDGAIGHVLSAVCPGKFGFTPRRLGDGLRFETTDLEWSIGDGALVRGPASDLLLGVMGRAIDWSVLDGDGVDTLRARL